MNENTIREMPSSLQQAGAEPAPYRSHSLTLNELSGMTLLRMHSLDREPETRLGLPPLTGGVRDGDPAILCLRPGEWLFASATEAPDALLEQVARSVDSPRNAVSDCSSAFAVFRLSGPGAPWLLNKLSGLDYQAGIRTGPHCARTRMAHAAVLVHYHEAESGSFVFDLIFDRSIARYIWDLLTASAPHARELAAAYGASA
jgi:heterotetrameric sarcosine oxidase gamma subunit